ncbi:ABC-F family ATP-binding cassette domain-containing protein [Mucilaginibacter dorajii]|uniref:ABC-F family ATP-binding cassette domain-containing protein n=1 Tax=Mucilaginibacter dorajii TaxID=692994 RepID=A0ABP7R7I5_9SPHI|nr:ABC-F family ATP-binding cassette domain-containing protein [Mucilaginibacter dorajii]MCS3737404.1 ATPase subunit of ABC transporter with duplicated ATPase domains [Mucilaginibacter dorajii]
MLILQDIIYMHPNRELLFSGINLIVNQQQKMALVGNNGIGKSTLLQLMAGNLLPVAGNVKQSSKPYYVPQAIGQHNSCTIAEALLIDDRVKALNEILKGQLTEKNFEILNDDWTIEERCAEAFAYWKLEGLHLFQAMNTLSGGQKMKVLLAGIRIHQPDIVLLDEPSNHLDTESRTLLYNYIQSTNHTLVVVSHDRALMNLLPTVCELSAKGITFYGGNYDFYALQKELENKALYHDLQNQEKALRKAKETERQAIERQQKLDARGKKKQENAGVARIMMNTLRNNAEQTGSKLKSVHAEKVGELSQQISQLRLNLPAADKMKIDIDHSSLHKGKILVAAQNLQFGYNKHALWKQPVDFQIYSGERLAIQGANGSGKTTLVNLILGKLQPDYGVITKADFTAIYIDQNYSLIDDKVNVYQQAQVHNSGVLQEHDVKIRLNRFLFISEDWDKSCNALSGGEKMRLVLCLLTISNQAPDMIVLDEPTNNLDLQNIGVLTQAINDYHGTLVVISHDQYFLQQVGVNKTILLN